MDITELINQLLFDYTIRTVALGTGILGIVSGALGSFAVLRRQSLLGDAMSHAALPGVVAAFMLTGSKSPPVLLLGAALAGLVGTVFMIAITRYTRIKEDSALGIILSVFFGFGLMLLTFLQRNPEARQAGLNTFLFGQAATLLARDVWTMAIAGALAVGLMVLFWKEFKLLSFDRDFGASLGYPMQALEVVLTGLLVIAIAIGLQAVGVVLMSAMVVAPAAAARQWTNALGRMVGLAAVFGAASGITGAVLSSTGAGLSTGPVIVLVVSAIVAVSLLFAPNRGLVWNALRNRRSRRALGAERVLADLYRMASQHADPGHPHSAAALGVMGGGRRRVRAALEDLARRGLVRQHDEDAWSLTPAGIAHAGQLLGSNGNNHR